MKKHLFFLLLFFWVSVWGFYAQPELRFERYTDEDGLPKHDITSIYQDHYGFIWFAPHGGLSRFDGIQFENYTHTNILGSLARGWVFAITGDKKNRLWVSMGENLMIFNYKTESFFEVKVTLPRKKEKQSIGGKDVFCDSKGYIWLCDNNVKVLIIEPDSFKVIKQLSFFSSPYRIIEDRQGYFWIGSSGEGLVRYDRENESSISYKHDPDDPSSLSNNAVSAIYEDSAGKIWVGTEKGGLNKFIAPTGPGLRGKFTHFKHTETNKYSIANNCIYSLVENSEAQLCIGTLSGLSIKNGDTGNFYNYYYDDRDDETITDNIIRGMLTDKTGNLWLATRSGIAKQKKQLFKTFTYSSYKNSISSNKVEMLYADSNDRVYIGTPMYIDMYDKKQEAFSVFSKVKKDGGKNLSGPPLVFFPDNKNAFWIGTWQEGLNYLDLGTKSFSSFPLDKGNPELADNNNVYAIVKDDEEHLWIGTWGGGLLHYNIKTRDFDQFKKSGPNTGNGLISNLICCIEKGHDENLWIGTLEGLEMFTPTKPYAFRHFLDFGKNTDSYIRCIYKGDKPYMWVGTGTGLYRAQIEKDSIHIIHTGFKQSVMSILEDNRNNLWIATYNSIVKFENAYKVKDDEKELNITTYRKQDGLQREFRENKACKLKDGTMFFGGANGLSMFHPDNIKADTIPPDVVLTDFLVHNHPVNIGDTLYKQIILNQSITNTRNLELNHKNNAFTIKFAALHYNNPAGNRYAYILKNYQEHWQYTEATKNEAVFMNLPPGDYIFAVKACNSDGTWNETPVHLKIYISPPWWQSWWFRMSLVLFIIGSIILLYFFRISSLRARQKELEKKVNERTAELKEMNVVLHEGKEEIEQQVRKMSELNKNLEAKSVQIEDMAKQLHEKDQKQLRFFANISHEFRTPLTLIIGPLERCLSLGQPIYWEKVNLSKYLKLMHRNSHRLLRLINQVIDFRIMEQGKKKLNVSDNNIVEFVQEIANAFSSMAEAKGIFLKVKSDELRVKNEEISSTKQLTTHHSSLASQFWFDPDVMEKILYNLISNAIKYTPEGGEINIQLRVKNEEFRVDKKKNQNENSPLITHLSSLIICIIDTGIGIKPENLDKIFDRFYRVKTRLIASQPEGTGIGLSYTKELVELHNGKIEVQSEQGKGTNFTIWFPMDEPDKMQSSTPIDENEDLESHKIGNNKHMHYSFDYTKTMIDGDVQDVNLSNESQGTKTDMSEKPSVLIVEDNTDMQAFIFEELKNGYSLYLANNGREGLNMAIDICPDLIISDIMMPEMDGIEFCGNIKTNENTSHIPVMLLTAKSGEENTIMGLETGADDYITKPFSIKILRLKINNILQARQQLREKFLKSPYSSIEELINNSSDKKFLEQAIKIVEDNFTNPNFTNDNFVSLCLLSKPTVYKKIKSLTNQTVSNFIRSIRLKKAAELLKTNYKTMNISEIGFMVGFKNKSDFTIYFTKMFGKNPSQFIKDLQ